VSGGINVQRSDGDNTYVRSKDVEFNVRICTVLYGYKTGGLGWVWTVPDWTYVVTFYPLLDRHRLTAHNIRIYIGTSHS